MLLTPTHKKLTTVSHCYCPTLSWTLFCGGFQREGLWGRWKGSSADRGLFPCLGQNAVYAQMKGRPRAELQPRFRVRVLRGWEETRCICDLVPASEKTETQQFLPWRVQLGGRQEVVGQQVEQTDDAGQPREDPEPQWQVLQGVLQLRVQQDHLAPGDAPLARVV